MRGMQQKVSLNGKASKSDSSLPATPAVGESVDWKSIEKSFEFAAAMAACPQDPVHHGEGDVWTHTKLVVDELIADREWQTLEPQARQELFWAALLHDIGKPTTTKEEGGKLSARGHARRGATMARIFLWQAGLPAEQRERICALVRSHMLPFFVLVDDDSQRRTIAASLTAGCKELAILARADTRGRICPDLDERLVDVDLFAAHCAELGCLDRPYPFASDHARFQYFRRPDRDPAYAAYDDTIATVIVMSGLPGAGKDHWVSENGGGLPVISLDRLRGELKVPASGDQGRVIAAAKEDARMHLRAGQSFIWNATNLSRPLRAQLIDLFDLYKARVEIISVEVSPERLFSQNETRSAAVPEEAILRMLERWEAPDLTEAHKITIVENS